MPFILHICVCVQTRGRASAMCVNKYGMLRSDGLQWCLLPFAGKERAWRSKLLIRISECLCLEKMRRKIQSDEPASLWVFPRRCA